MQRTAISVSRRLTAGSCAVVVAILSGVRHLDEKSKTKVTARTCLELMHLHGYTANARIVSEWNLASETRPRLLWLGWEKAANRG